MADSYIDYFEVSEYGQYFIEQARRLVGAWPLVDMTALIAMVEGSVSRVNREIEAAGLERSELRGGRMDTSAAADAGRKMIRRFHGFLRSVDEERALDREALFPGGKVDLSGRVKPADVKARLDALIRGLMLPANMGLPDHQRWQSRLTRARDELAAALASRDGAGVATRQTNAGLREAREEFLHVYNRLAKRLVRTVLIALDRESEMPLFFRDLQVNEDSSWPAPPGSDDDMVTPAVAS